MLLISWATSGDTNVQLAVKEGNEREVIGGVFFAVPEDFGFVGEWIADGGEAAFEELGEAFVLGSFGVGFEEVEGKDGILNGEDFVHQRGTVAFDAGEASGGEEGLDEVDNAVGASVLRWW